MKEQIKMMFEAITMPEATETAIRQSMASGRKRSPTPLSRAWRTAGAMGAALALVLALTPVARAAVDSWMVKYFWPGSDITIYEVKEGDIEATVAVVDTEAPGFARMINGRLYFLGNGEKIDITDQIAEDAPYYYSYTDDYGLTHDMVVGYSGTIDNFGIYEFIWREENGELTWKTGTGRNFMDSRTGKPYPWLDLVWEDLGIPWEKPE